MVSVGGVGIRGEGEGILGLRGGKIRSFVGFRSKS